jgi:hypothetical protein
LLASRDGGVLTLPLNRPRRTMRDALASEARAQTVNFATADAGAAFAAFTDKTEPIFTGEWAVK